jgi:hypothetical protein
MDAARPGASAFLFLILEEVGEALLGNELQQAIDLLGILHPTANAILHGGRHVDHPTAVIQADGKIEGRMLLALLAMAAGLATGAGHRDETAAKQWIVGNTLDGTRARMAFLGRALRS